MAIKNHEWNLRVNTARCINNWKNFEDGRSKQDYLALAELLNYPDPKSLVYYFTKEDARTCEALIGPNGYTIYKMLLARKNTS